MCGLVGLICNNTDGFNSPDRDVFKQMLFADTLRGADATGCFAVNKYGNIRGVKQAVPAPYFIQSAKFDEFAEGFLHDTFAIGHNRKATFGDKGDSSHAHPFMEENLVLVHNGSLTNHKELGIDDAEIDSDALVKSFARVGVEETLNKVYGAYALIWYDIEQKKLFFTRNAQRPLWMLKSQGVTALSSEPGLAYWVMARNNKKVDEVVEVKTDTLYSVHLDEPKEIEETELKIRPFVQQTPIYPHGGYSRGPVRTYREIVPVIDPKTVEAQFYTTEDIASMGVMQLYRTGDNVLIEIESYTKVRNTAIKSYESYNYEFIGKLANVDAEVEGARLTIRGTLQFVPRDGGVILANIASITTKDNETGLPGFNVTNCRVSFGYKSVNGVFVSREMFFSEYSERYCQSCLQEVRFMDMDELHAAIDGKDNILRFEHAKCLTDCSC